MKNARLVGGLAALALLLILLAAAPALAVDLPLVTSTTYATAANDGFADVVTGGDGVVYAAGYAGRSASGGAGKLLLVKYVDDGTSLTMAWQRLAGDKRPMSAVKLAVDASGNVIVAGNRGRTPGSSGSGDIVVLKYSPTGDLLWTSVYDGPARGSDYVKGLALDAGGNAIVCGASSSYRTGRDVVTLKMTADGRLAWTRLCRGPGNGDEARDLTVDDAGNVYVTGRTSKRWSASNSAIRPCSVVIAYSPEGHRRWVRLDDNARMTSGSTIVYSRAQGTLFFSGTRNWRKDYGVELLIRKIGTDNTVDHAWAFTPGAPYGYWPTAAAVDGAGVPVVAGVGDFASGVSAFLTGLSANGEEHWGIVYRSAFDNPAWAKFSGVAVGADGRMLAAGETATGVATGKSYRPTAFIVRYSPGLPVTEPLDYVGDGGPTSRDSCAAAAVGDKGMYAVGREAEGDGDSDAVLLKF
jgi:hypothetical protein